MPVALPIAAVIIALVAILVLYGGSYLAKAVAQLVPNVPRIGGAIKSVILAAATALESWALDTWDHVLSPAANFILAPIYAIKGMISDAALALAQINNTADWIIDTDIPNAIKTAETYAASKVTALSQRVTADVASLNSKITASVATAEAYTDALINKEAQRITDDVTSLNDKITAAIGTAEAYAAAKISGLAQTVTADLAQVDSKISAAIGAAEAYAASKITDLAGVIETDVALIDGKIIAAEQTAISSAVGIITTDIDQAIDATRDAVTDAIDGAIDLAGDGFADIVAGLRAIDWADVTDIAGVVASTGAIAATLGRYLEDCGMPNCRNLSGLGNFLQDLLSDVSLAALLAMLIEMVRNPESAAQTAVDDLSGVLQSGINLAESLLGV